VYNCVEPVGSDCRYSSHVICFCVNSVVRGTNVTFEFEFGDGTRQILTEPAGTVSQTHVYHDGECYDSTECDLFNS